jgi:hypothetical protein
MAGITNMEYIAQLSNHLKLQNIFVQMANFCSLLKNGGYDCQNYWTEEGWNWKSYKDAHYPLFWIREGIVGNYD